MKVTISDANFKIENEFEREALKKAFDFVNSNLSSISSLSPQEIDQVVSPFRAFLHNLPPIQE
jgi:hypothetical protein